MSRISAIQQRFIDEYLLCCNGTQAAIHAGYSARTAQQQASRLLRQPQIKSSIEARQQQASRATQISLHDLLAELELARVQALENGHCGAAISATMSKAKLLGLDSPQARPNEQNNEDFDRLSKVELV